MDSLHQRLQVALPSHCADLSPLLHRCAGFSLLYVHGSFSLCVHGGRDYCDIALPEGLQKNQKLWDVLVTPTTKATQHSKLAIRLHRGNALSEK